MKKVFTDIRCVMSKLKHELHKDCQQLTQINNQLKDGNESALNTTFEFTLQQNYQQQILIKKQTLSNNCSLPSMIQ